MPFTGAVQAPLYITYSMQAKCCCSQQLQFMSYILLLSNSKEYYKLIGMLNFRYFWPGRWH